MIQTFRKLPARVLPDRPFAGLLVVLLAVLPLGATPAAAADVVPAGEYRLEPSHASLLFKVDHLGFSRYTARFRRFDATLQFDPARLAASQVRVTIDATSIETDFPDPATLDFNRQLQGTDWLDAAAHPQMVYRSLRVVPTGGKTFRIEGELTLRGINRPLVLEARYNGGYAGHSMDPNARIGFSATGKLKRSAYGMTYGIPPAGSTLGVGDEVEVIVEAEFTGPPLKQPPAP
jgi:polyisoprenoid-binding protein YceI